MDFKSHSEFVLPPHKGVKPGKRASDPVDSPTGLPEPREYRRRASSSKLANDPDLEQTPEPLDRKREPARVEADSPGTDTTSMAERDTAVLSDEETATVEIEQSVLSDADTTTVEALVASAFASPDFQSAPVDNDDDDDVEASPPTVVLDDIPGPWEDDSRDESEDEIVTTRVRIDESVREGEGTAGRDVVLVVPPPEEAHGDTEEAIGANPRESEDAGDEVEEKKGTRIIEDENVIRAISSVVEKLDRMEDQLKQGVTDPASDRDPAHAVKRSRPDHRDFIIAYDEKFVGHFRTEKRISNKKAFQKAATALREKVYDFDPRLLKLYRPVPVKVENPESIPYVDGESFNWFGAPPTRVGSET